MIRQLCIGLCLFLGVVLNANAFYISQVEGAATVRSQFGYSKTVSKIKDALRMHGYRIVQTINRQRAARRMDIKMNPMTTVLFTKPGYDQQLIAMNPLSALFFPSNITVWIAKRHHVYVTYWAPRKNIGALIQFNDPEARRLIHEGAHRLNRVIESVTDPDDEDGRS